MIFMFYVYIIKSLSKGIYYKGVTQDVEKRGLAGTGSSGPELS
jgi:predicted GIY-YIG superfamily endonuclease